MAPATFWEMPPIGPTLPAASIVPVTATCFPWVRSPGDSRSMTPSVQARPADGPITEPESRLMSNGIFTSWSAVWTRSEEHTSELQSRGHLVCRLLLEKKKQNKNQLHPKKKKQPHTHQQ